MSEDPSSSPGGRAVPQHRQPALPNPEPVAIAARAGADWVAAGDGLLDAACAAARAAVRDNGRIDDIAVPVEVSLNLTTDGEMRTLNAHHRGRDRPTNVLSFPMLALPEFDWLSRPPGSDRPAIPVLLGDVALGWGVVRTEAEDQGKALRDHLSHLVVHGVLHLFGHDHQSAADARAMERIEIRILHGLGVADPYSGAPGGVLI